MPASRRYIQSVLGSPEASNTVARVLEPAATMATATAAEPVAGIAALLTGDADTVGRVQDRLTYNPRSKAGQEGLKALSDAFVEMAEAIGIDDAVAYFEDTVVPSLQSRFGTEVGSAMGAGILAGASIMAPGRAGKAAKVASEEPDLQFLHNTSTDKLRRQEAMGGMPMPSIAVTRQDIPFEGFGDITLVGKPESFDPKANRSNVVYDADAYTIRAPRPVKQANKDAYKKLNEEFGDIARKYDGYMDDVKYELADLETKKNINESGYNRIVRFFESDTVTDIAFLEDQGITDIPLRESGSVDGGKLYEVIEPMRDERQAWADNKLNEYFSGEELFITNPDRDYYTTGAKLKPYTSEEVTKFMKKRKGAGQESTMTVGVGKVRANLAKELKSLPQIRSEKGRLLTADDVSEFKTEMDSTLIDIQDSMEPFYKYESGGFAYRDEVGEMIYEADRIGLDRALQKFGFENVSEDMKDMIRRYQSDLRSGPTEYFEAKPGRSVNLSEFSGAIVPDNAPQSTIDKLEKAGLKVVKYKDSEGRLDARKAFPGTAFSIAGGIVIFKSLQEEDQQEDA